MEHRRGIQVAFVGKARAPRERLRGPCILADFGLETPIHGWAATAFLLGVDPRTIADLTSPAMLLGDLITGGFSIAPKAMILSRGDARGSAFGGNAYLGVLW